MPFFLKKKLSWGGDAKALIEVTLAPSLALRLPFFFEFFLCVGGMQALSEDALAPSPWGVWEKGIVSHVTCLSLLCDISCFALCHVYHFSCFTTFLLLL